MYLNAIALLSTIFLLNQHFKRPMKPVPKWVRLFVLKFLAIPFGDREWNQCKKLKQICKKSKKHNDTHSVVELDKEKESSLLDDDNQGNNNECMVVEDVSAQKDIWANEWAEVALVLDRLFFCLYLLVLVVATIGFIVTPLQEEGQIMEGYIKMFKNLY
eukprot:GHVT01055553.1.p1 GENE.GHVT01055553.1~~GHVT01055553.1.p1  ORF type:complete len:159 (-),score=9.48 GHVT01055553.1:42-518(-)